ncbi:hypothetical protein LL037_08635 [Clostridium estertheticum]|uniref:hypothetical protein n=1 Tax=Clostridium estertheticum TaxID=238834 RepID=UPI001C0B7E95|nr:hypothetical protein [Clostridium estertheticum]MBU3200346.1 hypothetical protein [Clostridium estertheticum]WAG67180.1 hypothetical protein LL037_08635 [Clostridium estertheticum]
MKKSIRIIPLILMLIILSAMVGCGNKDSSAIKTKDVREIVWTQLSKSEQNEIVGTWKDGKIEKNLTEKDISEFQPKDSGAIAKEVYSVTFKSKNEPTLGNVKKLVNIKSNTIVGTDIRK